MQSQCKFYDRCSAPVCPLFSNLDSVVWYPDEEICRNPDFREAQWRKTQLKIKRRAKDKERFFTFEMLNRNTRITSSIKGLKPNDENWQEKEKAWLKKHPHREKAISEEHKQKLLNGLLKHRETTKLALDPPLTKSPESNSQKFD